MALKSRIDSVSNNGNTGTFSIYLILYDEDNPQAAIARKCLTYSTAATEAQVRAAVVEAFRPSAKAYLRKLEVRNTIETILATLSVPTT